MSSAVNIPLSKQEVLSCIELALKHNFIDNLRHRHPNVALDSKIRGYAGELAFRKWMLQNGIEFSDSNQQDQSSGMDIDFVFESRNKRIELELKTSMLPDADEIIACAMKRRDNKLIKRGNQSIQDLKSDLHIQIIFKQLRVRKDEWLKKQRIDFEDSVEVIYNKIAAHRFETDTYLVGWIDKPTLIEQIKNKPGHLQKWKYGMREFWTCNLLREANRPEDLVEYLISF